MSQMIYNSEKKRMVPLSEAKASQANGTKYVGLDAGLCEQLRKFAEEDNWDFSGVTYITVKDAEGKTKKDKDGNPVYKLDKDGKQVTEKVEISKAKVTNAIRNYAEIAIKEFISARENAGAEVEAEPETED